MTRTLFQYRWFIWRHAFSDLRNRYAGTGMGIVWNIVHPLVLIVVYSIVFGFLFGRTLEGVNSRFSYAIFLCAGFFPWIAFSEALSRGATSFASSAAYLKKLPIPEQVFVAQSVASATLGLLLNFTLLIVVGLALGLSPTRYWLLLPIPLAMLQGIGFGFALVLGVLNVFFRDVSQLLGIALQVLFWATPIIYSRYDAKFPLPHSFNLLLAWNPLTPAIETVRDLFYWGRFPPAVSFWSLAGWMVVSVVGGHLVLAALRSEIRDVL